MIKVNHQGWEESTLHASCRDSLGKTKHHFVIFLPSEGLDCRPPYWKYVLYFKTVKDIKDGELFQIKGLLDMKDMKIYDS